MKHSFGLFERFGVELEYMLVDERTLDVRPEADRLIAQVAGRVEEDVDRGHLEWSNELALHLIELKTAQPAQSLSGLAKLFQSEVRFINRALEKSGARLLPTAMHPWMDPRRDSQLWPHTGREIYNAFDRLFDCSGHGWTNLQSTHLNLPFHTTAEFFRLHTAIRLLLPLLPVLAASSPIMEGRVTHALDMRLEVYRRNCRRIPSITGQVIPEPVRSPVEYRREILGRIYRDLAPHDPEGILRDEWTNARGAIARFQRNTIEIRLLDIQECPLADLAIVQAMVTALRRLTDQTFSSTSEQLAPSTHALDLLLRKTCRDGRMTRISNRTILAALGMPRAKTTTAAEVWGHLLDAGPHERTGWWPVVEALLNHGNLSERILQATGRRPNRRTLRAVYNRLADCLQKGVLFQ